MTNDLLTCLFDNDVMELLLLMAQRTNQVCGPRVLAHTYAFQRDSSTDSLPHPWALEAGATAGRHTAAGGSLLHNLPGP